MVRAVIADDEKRALKNLEQLISWEELNLMLVGKASNGVELLDLILSEKPEIVITDIRMPGMDGLSVIAQAMEKGVYPQFIITSAYANFEYARTAMQLGVKDFLPKPFRPAELNRLLGEIMQKLDPDSVQKNAYSCIITCARKYIKENFSQHLNLETVAAAVYVSPNYLSALFRSETGQTFVEYLTDVRLSHAEQLLMDMKYSVEEIAMMCGYQNVGHFTQIFKKKYAMSPGKFRKNRGLQEEAEKQALPSKNQE
ncbi:MAG: helix-turn-helix domain-containing protein [Lachnospiraceae bacterium]|nr:helix-turn-helix domain-containing protein [Robinsoniella sp.]MDY3767595.1 helix-turn-helix domain-containing protein [Lachnospiraceae bacterium]